MVDVPTAKQPVLDRASPLIAEARRNLDLKDGEFDMWIADLPNNTTNPPAIYLASSAAPTQTATASHKVGVCQAINSDVELYPAIDAGSYVYKYMNKEFSINPDGTERTDITESIVEQPKHGRIILDYVDENGYTHPGYRYVPDVGFGEFDNFVMEAKTSDITVQIYYTMSVGLPGEPNFTHDESTGDRIDDVSRCPNGGYWKISQLTSPQITFANLTGTAVGETTGSGANAAITLDLDAAGHGWYIGGLTTEDRGQNLSSPSAIFNPLSSVFSPPSSDWLPTSNPNEWVARAGTDAAGKMDMLSVLLHEYGHALGIEHSSDAHDYMATTLTPGLRRLPSSDEMQLMAQLAAEAREAIMAGRVIP